MKKADILKGLRELGYTPDLALETYENAFRNLPRQKHEEMFNSIVNQLNAQAQGQMSKEISMTENNNNNAFDFTVDLANGSNIGTLHATGKALVYGHTTDSKVTVALKENNGIIVKVGNKSGTMAKSALNAAIDYLYYGCGYMQHFACHLEPGLHLSCTIEELLAVPYMEDAGLVGPNYAGEAMIPAVRGDDWGVLNVNFGKFIVTKSRQVEDEARKHNFLDTILQGFVLEISLEKVYPGWFKAVAEGLQNQDKDAAWEEYQVRKSDAAARARAKQKGNEARAAAYKAEQGENLSPRQEAKAEKATIDEIFVKVGNETVTKKIADLEICEYAVLNTRSNVVSRRFNFTGSATKQQEAQNWAMGGYTLSKLN